MLRGVSSAPAHPSTLGPISLANVQVDLTNRLGAPAKLTPTGFAGLDALLLGGLRAGMVLGVTGAPGSGRTSLALMLAYMAARSQAGVCFSGRAIDDTEVLARFAARALRRSYPSSEVTYGDIWSGAAQRSDAVRRAISAAVETVVEKIGAHFYFARIAAGESLSDIAERSTQIWARYERVVLVLDDIEGLITPGTSVESRLVSMAYELKEIADHGCAVVFSVLDRYAELVSPAATAMIALRGGDTRDEGGSARLELAVTKNRLGGLGALELEVLFGASEFKIP
jgi:predicted ATP-dependent serine protease